MKNIKKGTIIVLLIVMLSILVAPVGVTAAGPGDDCDFGGWVSNMASTYASNASSLRHGVAWTIVGIIGVFDRGASGLCLGIH